MKKITFLFITLIFTSVGFSQKVKIDDNIAYVGGDAFIKFASKSVFDINVTISGLKADKDEIFVTYLSYNDPNKVTPSNTDGSVNWVELNFLTLTLKCEIPQVTRKGLVKFIIENNLYVDGVFNEEEAKTIVAKYGMRFSDNRPNQINININNN